MTCVIDNIHRRPDKNAIYINYHCYLADGSPDPNQERTYRKITSTQTICDCGHYFRNWGWTHMTEHVYNDQLTQVERDWLNTNFYNIVIVPNGWTHDIADGDDDPDITPERIVIIWDIYKHLTANRMYISWSVYEGGVRLEKDYDRLNNRVSIIGLNTHFNARGYTHITEKVYQHQLNEDERVWLYENFPLIEDVPNDFIGDEIDPDMCEFLDCDPECFGYDLHETECVDGVCVRGVLIEADSAQCDYIPADPCEGVGCEPKCYGDDLHETVCIGGVCAKGVMLEENSPTCGYVPPPPPPPIDLCEDVICDPECFGYDLHETSCDEGICIRGVLMESDSPICGHIPSEADPGTIDKTIKYTLIVVALMYILTRLR